MWIYSTLVLWRLVVGHIQEWSPPGLWTSAKLHPLFCSTCSALQGPWSSSAHTDGHRCHKEASHAFHSRRPARNRCMNSASFAFYLSGHTFSLGIRQVILSVICCWIWNLCKNYRCLGDVLFNFWELQTKWSTSNTFVLLILFYCITLNWFRFF